MHGYGYAAADPAAYAQQQVAAAQQQAAAYAQQQQQAAAYAQQQQAAVYAQQAAYGAGGPQAALYAAQQHAAAAAYTQQAGYAQAQQVAAQQQQAMAAQAMAAQQQQAVGYGHMQAAGYGQQPPPVPAPTSAPVPAPPPISVNSFLLTGCQHSTVQPIVHGRFRRLNEDNHGKPTYKKDEQSNGMDVMCYFWDDRDGADFGGWWFGPKVGGDQVWCYHPDKTSKVPPSNSWKVPYDGPMDTTMKLDYNHEGVRRDASGQPEAKQQRSGFMGQMAGFGQQAHMPAQAGLGQQAQMPVQAGFGQQRQMPGQPGFGQQAQPTSTQTPHQENLRRMQEMKQKQEEERMKLMMVQQTRQEEMRKQQVEEHQKRQQEEIKKMMDAQNKGQLEARSIIAVRMVVQKLKTANELTIGAIMEEVQTTAKPALANIEDKEKWYVNKQELEKVMEEKKPLVDQAIFVKKQQERQKALLAGQRIQALHQANRVVTDLSNLLKNTEVKANMLQQVVASLNQGDMPEQQLTIAIRSLEGTAQECRVSLQACVDFKHLRSADMKDPDDANTATKAAHSVAGTKARPGVPPAGLLAPGRVAPGGAAAPKTEFSQNRDQILSRLAEVSKQIDSVLTNREGPLHQTLNRAVALLQTKMLQSLMTKYDQDRDGMLSRAEIKALSRDEFEFEIDEATLDKMLNMLVVPGERGVRYFRLQEAKTAICVAREVVRCKRGVEERKEKQAVLSEAKQEVQRKAEHCARTLSVVHNAMVKTEEQLQPLAGGKGRSMNANAALEQLSLTDKLQQESQERLTEARKELQELGDASLIAFVSDLEKDIGVESELVTLLQYAEQTLDKRLTKYEARSAQTLGVLTRLQDYHSARLCKEKRRIRREAVDVLRFHQAAKDLTGDGLFKQVLGGKFEGKILEPDFVSFFDRCEWKPQEAPATGGVVPSTVPDTAKAAPKAPATTMVLTPQPGMAIEAGMEVRVANLNSAAHLNGMEGKAESFNPETKRWSIRLTTGLKAFKAGNLVPLIPMPSRLAAKAGMAPSIIQGMEVRIQNLQSATHLNGEEGVCEEFNEITNRWTVRLRNGNPQAFKADNLISLEFAGPKAAPKVMAMPGPSGSEEGPPKPKAKAMPKQMTKELVSKIAAEKNKSVLEYVGMDIDNVVAAEATPAVVTETTTESQAEEAQVQKEKSLAQPESEADPESDSDSDSDDGSDVDDTPQWETLEAEPLQEEIIDAVDLLTQENLSALFAEIVEEEELEDGIDDSLFLRLLRTYMKVTQETVMTTGMSIKFPDSKPVRRLALGEVVQVVAGPMKDPSGSMSRVHVSTLKDNLEGWVTLAGSQGAIYLTPGGNDFVCRKETILTGSFDMEDEDAVKKEVRNLQGPRKILLGELIEVFEWPQLDEKSGLTRMKGKLYKDSRVGWVTTIGNSGVVFLQLHA